MERRDFLNAALVFASVPGLHSLKALSAARPIAPENRVQPFAGTTLPDLKPGDSLQVQWGNVTLDGIVTAWDGRTIEVTAGHARFAFEFAK